MTTRSPVDIYIDSIQSKSSTTPAMISELNIFTLITKISGIHITSFDELNVASITNIFVYDIPEDKKEFNIETVRRCIIDIELKPYEGKNIYILRHFSTATIQAQNALLKILEECPIHAVILLEINNPNSILETIRSRIITLTGQNEGDPISLIGEEIVGYYKNKEYKKLAQAIYGLKCSSIEAIKILQGVYPYLSSNDMKRCDYAIESLSMTHENPKSILDLFFI